MEERFIKLDAVQLHVLESGNANDLHSLVCIAGGLGTGEVFEQTADELLPRKCFAITKRGNGQSDKPPSGYDLDTQANDLAGAIKQLSSTPVVILAYSAAVPSAILAASHENSTVAGLILCDYPAIYPAISESYVDSVTNDPDYDPQDCPPHVLEAIVRESERRELADLLPTIACPTLILHGLGEGSYLKPEALGVYKSQVPDVRAVGFEQAGHGFIMTHFTAFIEAVSAFLDEIES